MNFAYVIIRNASFLTPFSMVQVHLIREEAEAAAAILNAHLPEHEVAEHDEYGIVSGYEYQVITLALK